MEDNKFSNEMPEEVLLIPTPRKIRINSACAERAYGLFDTKTGTQVKDFVKGNGGTIEFNDLDPAMHYNVGVIENPGDEKPEFAMIWAARMRDVTDDILKNSNDLPIEYPRAYQVIFKDGNSKDNPIGNSVGNPMAMLTVFMIWLMIVAKQSVKLHNYPATNLILRWFGLSE